MTAAERQHAEVLTYPDDSFDLAVISAGLDDCASLYRALLSSTASAGDGSARARGV